MADAERRAGGTDRLEGIRAARDVFYEGEIAERIIEFIRDNPVEDASGASHAGLLSTGDFAEWSARIEDPLGFNYRGLDVYKCSSWTQGPVFLQQLSLLEGFDLRALGHNSADYLHTLIECTKLAFADREAYYGDPDFDGPPPDRLLSREYNDMRRGMIEQTASLEMRPGDAGAGFPAYADRRRCRRQQARAGRRHPPCAGPRAGPRPYRRHHASGRGRPRGQHGGRDAERRLAWHVAGSQGAWVSAWNPWPDVLPELPNAPTPSNRASVPERP